MRRDRALPLSVLLRAARGLRRRTNEQGPGRGSHHRDCGIDAGFKICAGTFHQAAAAAGHRSEREPLPGCRLRVVKLAPDTREVAISRP